MSAPCAHQTCTLLSVSFEGWFWVRTFTSHLWNIFSWKLKYLIGIGRFRSFEFMFSFNNQRFPSNLFRTLRIAINYHFLGHEALQFTPNNFLSYDNQNAIKYPVLFLLISLWPQSNFCDDLFLFLLKSHRIKIDWIAPKSKVNHKRIKRCQYIVLKRFRLN